MKPYFLLALAVLLIGCEPADDGIHGYVEGEFVMVAPTSAGSFARSTTASQRP